MKILIAIPSLDQMASDFAMSLASLLVKRAYDRKFRRDVDIALANCKGSLIMHSRNILMEQAIAQAATHIFFLDSDMVVPADTLERLIAHHVPIVGADYIKRVPPHGLNGTPRDDYRDFATRPLVPMLTLPFGCILISLKVLEGMPKPYFKYLEGETEGETQSEDTYFCNQARALGHTIWMDKALSYDVGHVGIKVFRAGK